MLVSTDKFTYNKERQQFVGEMSDLGPDFRFDLIFSDAMDVGMSLVNPKTGNEVCFYLDKEKTNEEGEILFWKLRSASRNPKFRDLTVVIFND